MKIRQCFAALLLLSLVSLQTLAAVSNDLLFVFAEANLPDIFPSPPQAGTYQGYDYRYYALTENYIAIDASGVLYLLGPTLTNNAIVNLGLVAAYEAEILSWENSHGALGLFTVNASCVVNKPCNERLVVHVTGGSPPYHYQQDTFANGTRPLNTNIDLVNGNIVGTPSQVGVSTFNLCAVDIVAAQNCQPVTVTVNSNVDITANPGAVHMKAADCYPSTCTVSSTILITSTTAWTSSTPGFGSLGDGFEVSPDSGPIGSTSVTISYTASFPTPANGFIRFRSSKIGVYAEVNVAVSTN